MWHLVNLEIYSTTLKTVCKMKNGKYAAKQPFKTSNNIIKIKISVQ